MVSYRDNRDDDDANGGSTSVEADLYIRPPRNPHDRTADTANDASDAVSLSTIIQWFKIMTTTEYIRHVKQSGWMPFNRRVWQRNYYERIIRDQRQLEATRRYNTENPARWAEERDDIGALLTRMEVKETL